MALGSGINGSAAHVLRDRCIIVTGAANGIGRAVCDRVTELGGCLVAVDTDVVGGERTVDAVRRAGAEAHFVAADVSMEEDVMAFVETAMAHFGRIDGLVNNAGVEGVIASTVDYPLDVFDRVLSVNVRGVFLGLKHILPVMIEQRTGAIVNLASVAGIVGHAGHAAYVASKHAVVGMTRVAAAEVAGRGVRVNAMCPGPTTTRMMDSIEEQARGGDAAAMHREIVAKIPAGRYGQPHEIARGIGFLLSDDAAFIHGAVLVADGGFTAAI